MARTTKTSWDEPTAKRLPRQMQAAYAWCYFCDETHTYDRPCRKLSEYRIAVVGDLEESTDADRNLED